MAKRVSFDCALPKIELKTLNIKGYNGAFMPKVLMGKIMNPVAV